MENKFNLGGALAKPPTPPTRIPFEVNEGIVGLIPTGTPGGYGNDLATSVTQIIVLDLLSEGEIEGLNSGEYIYNGTLGATGYSSAVFQPFNIAPGTDINFLRSIYWNAVPVAAPTDDGSSDIFNFQEAQVSFTPGGPLGALINQNNSNLSNALTISRTINERLYGGISFAKIYRIINKDCKAANLNIKIPQMEATSIDVLSFGDIDQTQISYNIYYRPLFLDPSKTILWDAAQVINRTVTGKINYGFIDSVPIPLSQNNGTAFADPSFLGWEIKIIRTTADSTLTNLVNITYVDSLTEIYSDIYTYPNSAIVASTFNATYFSSIPERAYDTKLIKVYIPSNYDPIKRVYGEENGGPVGTTAIWDGTFKEDKEWTDNPAWCLYDLMTNSRYGLGQYIDSSYMDKWTLYEISQYCDVLVPDGLGGIEPRFSCNIILNSRDQAYSVLNSFISMFRGLLYYGAGTLYTVQDAPKDPVTYFTCDNVENGNFTYSSSSRRVRHTVAIVRYNDKTNYWLPALEYVQDVAGIRQYGVREIQINAIGCTSRGQAIRFARWALLSEKYETESISFTAGLEGSYVRPGDIVGVYDQNKKTQREAGRTYSISTTSNSANIILDSVITGFNPTQVYNFSLLTPTFNYDPALVALDDSSEIPQIRNTQIQVIPFSGSQTSLITGLDSGVRTQINFTTPLDTSDYAIQGNPVFIIEASGDSNVNDAFNNQFDFYRIIRIEEKESSKFNISAIEYSNSKFDEIESGISFAPTAYLQNVASPQNLVLTNVNIVPDGSVQQINYSFTIPNLSGIISFPVYMKTGAFLPADVSNISGSQYLISILSPSATSGTFFPTKDGDYNFRVYSRNSAGALSSGFASGHTIITNVNPIKDVIISSLQVNSGFGYTPPGTKEYEQYNVASPTFAWQIGYQQTTIQVSDFTYRITIRQPSANNIPSNNIYFSATGYVPSAIAGSVYTFNIDDNISAVSTQNQTGPFREYDIVVEATDSDGNSSAGGNYLTNGDAFYNNSNGYDILYVNYPRISGIALSTGLCQPTDSFCSQQWITTDGDIRIYFDKFPANITNMAGGYVYNSQVPFTADEARGLVPTTKQINQNVFFGNTNSIDVVALLQDEAGAYMAISPFDTFDQAILDQGNPISGSLDVSNVVRIFTVGINPGLAFQAWLDADFLPYYSNGTPNYTGEGIAGIDVLSYTSGFMVQSINFNASSVVDHAVIPASLTPTVTQYTCRVFSVRFMQPFATNDYVVKIFNAAKTSYTTDSLDEFGDTISYDGIGNPLDIYGNQIPKIISTISNISKYTDHFTFAAQGPFFFGILR